MGKEIDNKSASTDQIRLQKAALKCVGTLAGGDPARSENVRRLVRQRLMRRYDRDRLPLQ